MLENYGIQEIKSVAIRAISPITIGDKGFGKGENILYITDVEVGALQEEDKAGSASGGFMTPRLINWISHGNCKFQLKRGILSKKDFNFLLDAKVIKKKEVIAHKREIATVDSNGIIKLKYEPLNPIYCYDERGYKIHNVQVDDKKLIMPKYSIGKEITIDYSFIVPKAYSYSIGENFLSNVIIETEVQFLLKDDNNGEEFTGVLKIPTGNLVGAINLIMGKKATPIVGDFAIYSVQSRTEGKNKHNSYTFTILDRDIDEI